jgi:hypothetical protein
MMAAVLKRWPWNSQSLRKIEGRAERILASDGYESFTRKSRLRALG